MNEHIKKAIALAKSDKAGDAMYFWDPQLECGAACYNSILLDPLFWQALSRAAGYLPGRPFKISQRHIPDWERWFREFIEHLILGKPADDFFKDLLK